MAAEPAQVELARAVVVETRSGVLGLLEGGLVMDRYQAVSNMTKYVRLGSPEEKEIFRLAVALDWCWCNPDCDECVKNKMEFERLVMGGKIGENNDARRTMRPP